LKLHDLPPAAAVAPVRPPSGPEPVPPAIAVEDLEAAIEASHPEHVPEGPAEPPIMVPAFGETPIEDDEGEAEDMPAVVVSGQMPAPEPLIEAPVTYFVPAADAEEAGSAPETPEAAPMPPPGAPD